MKFKIDLAGIHIILAFSGQVASPARLFKYLYKDFIAHGPDADGIIEVDLLGAPLGPFHPSEQGPNADRARRVPYHEAIERLDRALNGLEGFPLSERTVFTLYCGGLLLFDPDNAMGRIYISNPDAPCPFGSLYRLVWIYLAQVLGERGGCFLHAAALVRQERGYLFLGDSGAGKSTLARLGGRAQVFSDDGPVVLGRDREYLVHPSPYHQLGRNTGLDRRVIGSRARIHRLFFLVKGDREFLEPLSTKEAFPLILNRYIHFFPHLTTRAKSGLFELFHGACRDLPACNLHFRGDQEVWQVIGDE